MPFPKTSQDTEKSFPDRFVSQKRPTPQSEPKSGTLWRGEAGHFGLLVIDKQAIINIKLFDLGLPKLN